MTESKNGDVKPGFTLLELLVVIAIVGVLIGILLPAVQRVREAANKAKCQNNLHQLGIAAHMCHDTNRKLPPALGWYPGPASGAYGPVPFHLLPYLEQNNLFQSSPRDAAGNYYSFDQNSQSTWYSVGVKVLLCPSDPTIGPDGVANLSGESPQWPRWGASCYASNYAVFGGGYDANGNPNRWQGAAAIPVSFPDGTSTTILFAEKYAVCTAGSPQYSYKGGSLWAWPKTATCLALAPVVFGFLFVSGALITRPSQLFWPVGLLLLVLGTMVAAGAYSMWPSDTSRRKRAIAAIFFLGPLLVLFTLAEVIWYARGGTVTGKVTFNGQGLPSGKVSIMSEDGIVCSGDIRPDGNYTVYRVPRGPVKIAVATYPPPPPGRVPVAAPKYIYLPRRYRDFDKSGLRRRVTRGEQVQDIELEP